MKGFTKSKFFFIPNRNIMRVIVSSWKAQVLFVNSLFISDSTRTSLFFITKEAALKHRKNGRGKSLIIIVP